MERFLVIVGKFLTSGKFAFGLICSLWALLAPIHALFYFCFAFILVEYITWNVADWKVKKRAKAMCKFDLGKAQGTFWTLVLVNIGILWAWSLDVHILGFLPGMYLAEFFAAFFSGIEFLKLCVNAYDITQHSFFKFAPKFFKDKMRHQIDFDEYVDDAKNDHAKDDHGVSAGLEQSGHNPEDDPNKYDSKN